MNAILNYPGAKWGMAEEIVSLMPPQLNGWSRITRKSYNQNADQRTEVLWCNFEVGQTSMFDKEIL